MKEIIQKNKNNFILQLSYEIYPREVVEKAAAEFPDFVSFKGDNIEIETDDVEDVLEWLNYLIYERRK